MTDGRWFKVIEMFLNGMIGGVILALSVHIGMFVICEELWLPVAQKWSLVCFAIGFGWGVVKLPEIRKKIKERK